MRPGRPYFSASAALLCMERSSAPAGERVLLPGEKRHSELSDGHAERVSSPPAPEGAGPDRGPRLGVALFDAVDDRHQEQRHVGEDGFVGRRRKDGSSFCTHRSLAPGTRTTPESLSPGPTAGWSRRKQTRRWLYPQQGARGAIRGEAEVKAWWGDAWSRCLTASIRPARWERRTLRRRRRTSTLDRCDQLVAHHHLKAMAHV